MTDLIPLKELFQISYGNQFDLSKLKETKEGKGINFVNRGIENCGVVCQVHPYQNTKPFPAGMMSVALGGSILSAFVQQKDFYTGQNIKVLMNEELSLDQKLFYCYAISYNRYRYSSHIREANKTLDWIKVPHPDTLPIWVKGKSKEIPRPTRESNHNKKIELNDREWRIFNLIDIFNMYGGKHYKQDSYLDGDVPIISTTTTNNGILALSNLQPKYQNSITIGKVGCITFYQEKPFVASGDVTVLEPKKNMRLTQYTALFIVTLMNHQEEKKWDYGNQIRLNDCQKLRIRLPVTKGEAIDWQFMDDYIQSLPYSKGL